MTRRRTSPPEAGDSIDIKMSSTELPKSPNEVAPDTSGSLDVQFSSTTLPKSDSRDGDPGKSGSLDVQFSSTTLPRQKRAATSPGALIHKIGDSAIAHKISDGAHKISDKLGESAHRLGAAVNDRIDHLPVMPKSRKSRVLVRSLVVGFVLVFSWIAVIVGLQLRRGSPPDFRPLAEHVMVQLRDGHADQVYEDASTRLREVVLEESFIDEMADLNTTLGSFREITAVIETETPPPGPGGKTGRVEVQLDFAKGTARANLSFHWEENRWKLLGISVALPPDLVKQATSEQERSKRVAAPPEVLTALEEVLERSRRGEADAIWTDADPLFQRSVPRDSFRVLEADNHDALGTFQTILKVTASRQNPSQSSASIDAMIQYEKATTTGSFQFAHVGDAWKLTKYYIIHPLPHAPRTP